MLVTSRIFDIPVRAMDIPSQYKKLERYLLSEHLMQQYSFPRPHATVEGQAVISNARDKYTQIPSELSRICRRCEAVYSVEKNGKNLSAEVCRYHSYSRNPGRVYRCCNGGATAKPCRIAPQHVHGSLDLKNLTGFFLTKDNTSVTSHEAYAVDTEMIYTDGGLEVGCLSVVNSKCQLVYETMVVPDNPIVDYNTEFSGLKSSDFIGVTTTMKDVHEKLQSLWGPNTILVGHGLESDLIKLRVIHDKVVDTRVLYPHKKGLPFMNSLKNLREIYLPQRTNAADSYKCGNDAFAVMALALRKP